MEQTTKTANNAELFWTLIALVVGGAAPIGLLLVSTSITMMRQPATMMEMMMSIHSVRRNDDSVRSHGDRWRLGGLCRGDQSC